MLGWGLGEAPEVRFSQARKQSHLLRPAVIDSSEEEGRAAQGHARGKRERPSQGWKGCIVGP